MSSGTTVWMGGFEWVFFSFDYTFSYSDLIWFEQWHDNLTWDGFGCILSFDWRSCSSISLNCASPWERTTELNRRPHAGTMNISPQFHFCRSESSWADAVGVWVEVSFSLANPGACVRVCGAVTIVSLISTLVWQGRRWSVRDFFFLL